MKYLVVLILGVFVNNSVAQTSDYDSVYLLNNCVVLDAKESIQADRADLIYKWTFANDTIKYGEVAAHCYDSLGTYDIVLSVIDPQANALFEEEWLFQVTIAENYRLSFELQRQGSNIISAIPTLSFQNAPNRIGYFWDFGDGKFATGEEVEHEYLQEGRYHVRLLAKVEGQDQIINLSLNRTIVIEGDEDI
ncbi:PKD domain-containing protein [Reichenbachiella faecimaris]|nr:PKD domain-containing protein [Reichenbachiella faecimaris]